MDSEGGSISFTFVDVGQGDSTLIRLPSAEDDGHAILIDCPQGRSQTVLGLLDAYHITRLDLVVVTHSHKDHLGGIHNVLVNFCRTAGSKGQARTVSEIAYLVDAPGLGVHVRDFNEYVADLLDARAVVWLEPWDGTRREYGSVHLTFLHPDQATRLRTIGRDPNTASHVLVVEYAGVRVLFASDLTEAGWHTLEQRYPAPAGHGADDHMLQADVLKYPHHGGAWPTASALLTMLQRVRPVYVVLSVGTTNSYQHPTAQVFEMLRALPSVQRVLCTQATPGQCQAPMSGAFSCAGSVELIITPDDIRLSPSLQQHLLRIRRLRPSCRSWLPADWQTR